MRFRGRNRDCWGIGRSKEAQLQSCVIDEEFSLISKTETISSSRTVFSATMDVRIAEAASQMHVCHLPSPHIRCHSANRPPTLAKQDC